jgi:hypothetical protein
VAQTSFVLTALKYLLTLFGMLRRSDLTESELQILGQVLIFFDCLVIFGGLACVAAIFVLLKRSVKDLKNIHNGATPTSAQQVVPKTSHLNRKPSTRPTLSMAHLQKAINHQKVKQVEEQSQDARAAAVKKLDERHRHHKNRTKNRLARRTEQSLGNSKSVKIKPVAEEKTDTKDTKKMLNAAEPLLQQQQPIVQQPTEIGFGCVEKKSTSDEQSKRLMQQVEELRLLIASKVTNEKVLIKVFEKLDKDNNGTLSPKEFKVLVENITKTKAEPALIQGMWQTAQTMRNDNTLALSNEEISLDTLRSFLKVPAGKSGK